MIGAFLLGALTIPVGAQSGPFSAQIQRALKAWGIISPGVFRAADGTAAVPSYSFVTDPTTGIYRAGTSQLGITTGGTLRVTLGNGNTFWANTEGIGYTDVWWSRDASDTLAQRRGTNAQLLRVYNTFTDAANYERLNIGWSSNTAILDSSAAGTGVTRGMSLRIGGTSYIDLTGGNVEIATGRALRPIASAITAGGATGLTVNNSGDVRDVDYKVTIASTAFICAALVCDVTIATLPADTALDNVYAKLTQTFACAGTCTTATLSALLGKGAGGAEYLASFDADAATLTLGDADAELGTLLVRAAAIQGQTYNTASQAVVLRLTSGTGNIGTGAATNLSQGSVTVYLTTRVKP